MLAGNLHGQTVLEFKTLGVLRTQQVRCRTRNSSVLNVTLVCIYSSVVYFDSGRALLKFSPLFSVHSVSSGKRFSVSLISNRTHWPLVWPSLFSYYSCHMVFCSITRIILPSLTFTVLSPCRWVHQINLLQTGHFNIPFLLYHFICMCKHSYEQPRQSRTHMVLRGLELQASLLPLKWEVECLL